MLEKFNKIIELALEINSKHYAKSDKSVNLHIFHFIASGTIVDAYFKENNITTRYTWYVDRDYGYEQLIKALEEFNGN